MSQVRPLRFQRSLDLFLVNLRGPGKVVELNAERGLYTQQFLSAGHLVQAFGLQDIAPAHEIGPDRLFLSEKSIDEVLIPYRTVVGIWARDSFDSLTQEQTFTRLRMFYDWLVPNGVCSFCVQEGEGYKLVTEQGISGAHKRRVTYYQPEHIENIIYSAGFQTKEAWREQHQDRRFLHILISRPSH